MIINTNTEAFDKSLIIRLLLIMNLIVLLIIINVTVAFANAKAQIISLKGNNITLMNALMEIKKQSGYSFFLNNKQLANQRITAQVDGLSVEETLNVLLDNTSADWELRNKTIVIKPKVSNRATSERKDIQSVLDEEQYKISGIVVDESGNALEGVTVTLQNTNVLTTTDVSGKYTLNLPDANSVLVFSMIGFTTIEKRISEGTTLNVVLKVQVDELDELVIVGYGTQKKVNLTGAVNTVSSNDLLRRTTGSVSVALQGLVPGLSAVQSSGQPGGDNADIKIRGMGSLNSTSSPLVLIDGVEGDMNRIDMNSIESISVLKDAASASIYGSRASNGVILITTKRGKEGNVQITYNGYLGQNKPTELPESVSAVEFMEAMNLASKNANQVDKFTPEQIDLYKNGGADNVLYYDTNWKDQVLKKNANMQNHSVSLSGGTDKVRFFGSAGYLFQDGQIRENNFSRTNIRLNTDIDLREWLKVGVDVNIRNSHAKRPVMETPVNIIGYALTLNPLLSGRNADGTYGYGINGINPIALAEVGGVRNDMAPEMGVRSFVNITPMKGIDIMGSYSFRKLESEMDAFVYPYQVFEGGVSKGSFPSSGSSRAEERSKGITKQFNLQASYENNIFSHYFKVLGGIQSEELNYKMISARRENFIIKEYNELFNGDPAKMSNSGNRYDYALMSYLFRVNYAYADKYLLEVNGRYDGSSRFIGDNRWGFFPSISAGWRISQENFFEPIKPLVNEMKFRWSYGVLGNQSISGYYPYTSLIASGYNYWFNKGLTSGATQTQLANEMIAWEKSKQMNFGVDIGMLNNRLNMTFDYYKRDITDMLQRFDVPNFVGMTAPWENAGTMRNTGWDFQLNWKNRINGFGYYATANLSDVSNKIINLFGNEYLGAFNITREGDPYNSYFGYLSDGIFQSQADIDAVESVYGGKKENVRPGFIKYKDTNNDGVIDTKDRVIIGNPSPRYEYSFTLGADWKGVDFSAFFQGVGKRDMFYTGPGARPLFGANTTLYKHQLDSWTEENRDAAYPILLNDVAGTGSNNIVSDYWIRSVSYLRLKNLVIGYTLPNSFTKKFDVQTLRFYFSGQNLFTKSNAMKGYDPENSVSNGNYYPVMKSLNFGLNMNF